MGSLARLKQTHINIQYLVGGSRFSSAEVVEFYTGHCCARGHWSVINIGLLTRRTVLLACFPEMFGNVHLKIICNFRDFKLSPRVGNKVHVVQYLTIGTLEGHY